jgi:hypothetical protein
MKLALVGLIVPCDRSHRTVLLALSPLVRLLFLFFSYIFPPITVNEDTVPIELVTDLVFFAVVAPDIFCSQGIARAVMQVTRAEVDLWQSASAVTRACGDHNYACI